MKNYREVADDVFRRSETMIAENRRKNTKRMRIGVMTACFCLIALFGVGVWQSGMLSPTKPDSGVSAINSGADTMDTDSGQAAGEASPASSDGGSGTKPQMSGGVCLTGSETGVPGRTMISAYGNNPAAFSYETPENGVFQFSIPLKGALDEYGASDENGEILYRVVVCLFKDKNELDAGGDAIREEGDRLFARGYTVAMETYHDGLADHDYFTLHATKEQLIHFAANEEYGYRLFLYDEVV